MLSRKGTYRAAGAAMALAAVLVAVAITLLDSAWLQDRARARVISEIEKSTGTAIEVKSFRMDWVTRTVEMRGLTAHGRERTGEGALLTVDMARARYRIRSLLEPEFVLESLDVAKPEINLIVRSDGTTNLPSAESRRSRGSSVDLKVRSVHVWQGTLTTDNRRVPFSFRGENLSAVARYETEQHGYRIRSSIGQLDIPGHPEWNGHADLDMRLGETGMSLESLHYFSTTGSLEAKGAVLNFAHPELRLQIHARVEADQFGIPQFKRGEVAVYGAGQFRGPEDWTFEGRTRATELQIGSVRVNGFANVQADRGGLQISEMQLRSGASAFSGRARLSGFKELTVDGRMQGVSLRETVSLVSAHRLPWTALMSGPVHLTGFLEIKPRSLRLRNVSAEADAEIQPQAGGILIAGHAKGRYDQRTDELTIASATLTLPHSRASFEGVAAKEIRGSLDSTDLADLTPLIPAERQLLSGIKGKAHFDGALSGWAGSLRVAGNFELADGDWRGQQIDSLRSAFQASSKAIDVSALHLTAPSVQLRGRGSSQLADWHFRRDGATTAHLEVARLDLATWVAPYVPPPARDLRGLASGTLNLQGELSNPEGGGEIEISHVRISGEEANRVRASLRLTGDRLSLSAGRLQDGPATVAFSGDYQHGRGDWGNGIARIKMDSNVFPLSVIDVLHRYNPALEAQSDLHAQLTIAVRPGHFDLREADGSLLLRKISIGQRTLGDLTFQGRTDGARLETSMAGNLLTTRLNGQADVLLVEGNPARGTVDFDRLSFAALRSLLHVESSGSVLPLDGFVQGRVSFDGPLAEPAKLNAHADVKELDISSKGEPGDLVFRNSRPVMVDAAGGEATVHEFDLSGAGTDLRVAGSFPYLRTAREGQLSIEGTAQLQMLRAFNPELRAAGTARIGLNITGSPWNPKASGTIAVNNASLAMPNAPAELTALNGTILFNQSRATIQRLTGQAGGGQLSLAGFVNYGAGALVYSLNGQSENVRIRSAGGISMTASSQFQLTGTSERSILSGGVTVSRVILNPNSDLGNLLTSIATPVPAPGTEKDFRTGMQFDVAIESAPNLQVTTAFSSDVQAEIDVRLRGTPSNPALLGSIYVNEGDVRVFGARYSINRGEVTFVNAARIEPVLDLDVQTQVRGIVVNITIAGTLGRLNINYRSDPPLQPRDIIALLTVGRTPELASNVPASQTATDVTSLQTGANTVLGQAFAPPSNRLSKLFGITNIKIDPLVQGLTTTPQARLTLEQQISKQIAVTYVTNLSQTSEQIFRVEWSFSPHYSVVAIRDDNGEFGLDLQYRRRFK